MEVKQYPHRLVYQSLAPEAVQDATGHWITPDAGSTTIEHDCRAEVAPNSQTGGVSKSTDGQNLVFSWVVYAPLDCPVIPIGQQVTIYDGLLVRATGTVERFAKGQLSTRFWL